MAEPADSMPSMPFPSKPQQSDSKIIPGFFYKAIFGFVFLALLPLFPTQAPEFVTHSIFTKSWELLHLLVVGIAISYGLFSRRNTDPEAEKEAPSKYDTPHSYVSRILQVSSVFDDEEADAPSGSLDEGKVQTWSSVYYRNKPAVVVAKESINGGRKGDEPLSLPVRSLRSVVSDNNINNTSIMNFEYSDSNNAFSRVSSREETKVLPSPIPWRSRSGRIEFKDDSAGGTYAVSPPPYSLPPSAADTTASSFKSASFRSSSTPEKLSPSPSLSPELRAKTNEDSLKRKKTTFYPPPPPPTPPPPPPSLRHGSISTSPDMTDMKRRFKDELKDMSIRGREGFFVDPRNASPRYSRGKSVRTVRSKKVQEAAKMVDTALPLPKYQFKTKNDVVEEVVIDSEDSDEEHSSREPSTGGEEDSVSDAVAEAEPDENEVDKKADEFIAKFREQIRLQRIESIKRDPMRSPVKRRSSISSKSLPSLAESF